MSIKYKIDDAKKNKNLINDEIKLSRVKTKDGPGSDGGRKPGSTNKITLAKLSDKVDNLSGNLNKLAEQMVDLTKTVKDGFERQEKFNKTIVNRLDRIVKVNNLKE